MTDAPTLAATLAHPAGMSEAGNFRWALRIVSRTVHERERSVVTQVPGGARGYLVLTAAAQDPERSQLVLARRLRLDRSVLTAVLDVLEQADLVVRRPDAADRRARLVTVTPGGTAVLALVDDLYETVVDHLLRALDPSDAVTFRTLFGRIATTATDDPSELGATSGYGGSATAPAAAAGPVRARERAPFR